MKAVRDGEHSDAASVCSLLSSVGAPCGRCSDGARYCNALVIERVPGPAAPFPVVARTAVDIAADATCR